MKEVISKILIFSGIIAMFVIFIFTDVLVTSKDSNKQFDHTFSENILP